MRRRYAKLAVLLMAVLVFATGCWDALDIEDRNIATTVILDKKDGAYNLYIEIADITSNRKNNIDASSSDTSFEQSGFTFTQSSGESLIEARQNLDVQMDKPLYLSGVRTLIITERTARTELAEYLFRLKEDLDYRQKVDVFITKEEPEDLEKSKTENSMSFGFAVDDMMDQMVDNGQAFSRMTARYMDNILSHSGFCMPRIDLQANNMILSGYCVIDNNARCIGFIPLARANGLLFMKADAATPRRNYAVPLKENKVTLEVKLSDTSTEPIYTDGKMRFEMQYNFDAQVQYFEQINAQPMDENVENEIKAKLEEMLKEELDGTIEQSQKEYKCDYLQFDDKFRIKYPEEFNTMDWPAEYPKAEMRVNVEVNVKSDSRMDYNPS